MSKAIEGIHEQFAATLEPLQQQLRETVKSIAPRFDLKAVLPNLDHLVAPEFARPPEYPLGQTLQTADAIDPAIPK